MEEENKNTGPGQPAEKNDPFMDDGSSFMEKPLNDSNDLNDSYGTHEWFKTVKITVV